MKKTTLQQIIAFSLIGVGVVWSTLFPKKMSLDPDMVLSVGIGVGLVATGGLVLCGKHVRPLVLALTTMLLWSLVANAYLLAWQDDAANTILAGMKEGSRQPQSVDPSNNGR